MTDGAVDWTTKTTLIPANRGPSAIALFKLFSITTWTIVFRVGVNSIPELELQINSNSKPGIGIGIKLVELEM